jgi:ABC-2 type transport system ATP-binding protein
MKQRVKMAQALGHDPKLLLLDAPTKGLDPARRVEMLELIGRTGREFGISVIVSSHLLSEIEQVCDYLVVIEEGRLHSAAPLADFTKVSGVLVLEVDDEAEALAAILSAAGLAVVVVDQREVDVSVNGESVYDIVRDAVAQNNISLHRMELRRSRLEDIFDDS